MSRFRRFLRWAVLPLAIAVLLGLLGGIALLKSNWFKEQVRSKIAAVVEDASGGRVEIGAFQYDWKHLTASVAPFTLHGKEAAGQPPFLTAKKIEIGLKVISVLESRIDLAFVTFDRPQLYIAVAADGTSNLPVPRIKHDLLQEFLDLKIRQFTAREGFVDYNSQRIPLDLTAANVSALLRYDASRHRYLGELSSRSLRLNSPDVSNAVFTFETKLALEKGKFEIANAKFGIGQSRIEFSGTLEDLASPRGAFNVNASLRPQDITGPLHLPVSDQGSLRFEGQANFHSTPAFDWEIQGKVSGRGLAYHSPQVNLNDIGLTSGVTIRKSKLALTNLTLAALGGAFRGHLEIADGKKLTLSGDTKGISIQQFAGLLQARTGQVNGIASGPVQIAATISKAGLHDFHAEGKLNLEPVASAVPLQGFVDVNYDQNSNLVNLGASKINLGTSHVEMSGGFGQTLTVHATTKDLRELLAILPLSGAPIPKDLPIQLHGGTAVFDGTISGPLADPRISGHIDVANFAFKGEQFNRLDGGFDITNSGVSARNVYLSQGPFQLQVTGHAGLLKWALQDSSPISGSIVMRGAEIKMLLDRRKWTLPITGVLAATAEIKGTYGSPQATAGLDAENVIADGAPIHRVRASVIVSGNTVQVIDGRLNAPAGQLAAKGSYQHAQDDWSTGHLNFEMNGKGLALAKIKHIQDIKAGIGGQMDVNATGAARFTKGEFRLETVASETNVRNASLDGHRYGTLTLTANTRGLLLDLRANANFLNTPIQGSGEWKLEGDDPGHGEIQVPHITMATLHELMPAPERKLLPFEGFIEGKIDIDGPLRKPDQLKATISVNALQVNASPGAKPRAGAQSRDLVLRNAKPIVLVATTKAVEIRSAQLTGTDTTVDAAGRLSFESKSQWDLKLKGSINLAVLQIFNPDLLGSGVSVVDATVRGTFSEPQVEGRLELKNASLYLTDLPNGLDQANGVILFDRNRATVDSLAAVTGGGRVTIQKGSFVGFRGPVLLYQVQASADHVRYRSPEGVSITVNAALNIFGTSENSVLSGTVTVIRAGFNPTTDIGGLLASTARPVSTPSAPNEYLRGMQFDVRVESAQALEIETSLVRNIQAEANLRLRGTPDRPLVLGNLIVNQGQIEFFGNKYTINRGEVNFYNAVKIEPIIDMDLETSVRGITVDVTFAGPLNKLNFSYRSDPPLQTNDIIALLAVGRTPNATGGLASSQAPNSASYLSTGTSSLLSQAISAPATGRLQRFFGVSHIKIDPQLTDITSVPQARLTLEQQISREITLTYITNLARTQEQIIRVEWDLSRQWSVIALRDENGAFGIDFQYRKRFK